MNQPSNPSNCIQIEPVAMKCAMKGSQYDAAQIKARMQTHSMLNEMRGCVLNQSVMVTSV